MPTNPLVSESESSSEESGTPAGRAPAHNEDLSPKAIRVDERKTEGTQQPEREGKEETDDDEADDEQVVEGTPNIKNEMVKSKITLNASVLLTRLSPDSNKVISKLQQQSNEKITIRCVPIASAPELTPNVFKISSHQPFATLIKFLIKKLKKRLTDKNGAIHCYIHNSFVPSPDEVIGDLYHHFGTNGELVVSYSTVVAFG